MRRYALNAPQLGLIAGTRALLGARVALLLSETLNFEPHRTVGWSLFCVGAVSTAPLLLEVMQAAECPR